MRGKSAFAMMLAKFIIPQLILIGAIHALRLSEHIGDYEALEYNKDHLRERHSRSRRSVYDKIIKLDIKGFDRMLPLRLHPDVDTFHPNAVVEIDGVDQPLDTSHLFEGVVEGHVGSKVYGAITDGVFHGKIELPGGDQYHVEKKQHYGENKDLSANEKAHSVIYHDKSVDVEGFYRGIRERRAAVNKEGEVTGEFCGSSNKKTYEWMERVKQSAEPPEDNGEGFVHRSGDNPYLKSQRDNPFSNKRKTRAAASLKTTCNLFLQGDPELWRYFKSIYSQFTDEMIREEISALFHQHVKTVTGIYTKTTFRVPNAQQSFTNHGFRVDRVLMNKTCECTSRQCSDHPFCSSNIDASNLLNLNSIMNHNDYCLAYLFTYRDFDGGTLGLAWVAEPGKVGGVCSAFGNVRDGDIQGTRSLNTGIITLNNYKKRVPPRVSYLTFAHELGHNFGAKHDEEGRAFSCAPYSDNGSPNGNYIMFASATSGTKENNDEFSVCSIISIAQVLNSVVNNLNSKRNCFKEAAGAWCGNQIREEESEECDCGYAKDCPTDCCKCCRGQSDANDDTDACKLKSDAHCDPSQGTCCNGNCGFQAPTLLCKPADMCTNDTFCDGSSAACPKPSPKPDNTVCGSATRICKNGECSNSICELIDNITKWFECEPEEMDPNKQADTTAHCFVSCSSDNTTCYSSYNSEDDGFPPKFRDLLNKVNNGSSIKMPAGHICNKNKGFCDDFQKCRHINAQGPLARLKDLLFSESTLLQLKIWVTKYWYAVALSILGFIGIMVLFVKCCAVHTPSSNPKKAPARRISQTLTLRRRQQAQAGHAPSGQDQRRPLPRNPQPSSRGAGPSDNFQLADLPPSYHEIASERPNQPRDRSAGQRAQPVQSREQRRQQYEMQQRQLMKGKR